MRPLLGQHHLVRHRLVIAALAQQGDRQDGLDGRAQVAALRKRQRPADHRKGAAVPDVARHVLQIGHREVTPRVEVLEDDEVEVPQLLREQPLGGERDEAELVLRYVRHVVGGAQDDERQQVDAGVELEGLAQETVIPGRTAAHQQHADLVAHHGEREIHAVVVRQRLAAPRGEADRVGELADRVGLQGEGQLLLGGVRGDLQPLGRHHAPVTLQDDGQRFLGIAPHLDGGGDGRRVVQEGQRRRLHVNDADVAVGVQVADADGHHRHPRPLQVAEAGIRAVMHAVAEHHDAGRRRPAVVVEHLRHGADQVRAGTGRLHLRQVAARQHAHGVVELVQRDLVALGQLVQCRALLLVQVIDHPLQARGRAVRAQPHAAGGIHQHRQLRQNQHHLLDQQGGVEQHDEDQRVDAEAQGRQPPTRPPRGTRPQVEPLPHQQRNEGQRNQDHHGDGERRLPRHTAPERSRLGLPQQRREGPQGHRSFLPVGVGWAKVPSLTPRRAWHNQGPAAAVPGAGIVLQPSFLRMKGRWMRSCL